MNCLHLNDRLICTWKDETSDITVKTIYKPIMINFTTSLNNLYNTIAKADCNSTWLSFLQSNLQKAIRRNKTKIAVNTAKEMTLYKGGWTKLIRRLGIIVIEDKLDGLDLNYSTLLWLTAVAPYRNEKLEQWVFNYVLYLCNQKFKALEPTQHNLEPISQISKSLKLRTFYGGMKGDINLLNKAVNYYSDKLNEKINFLPIARPNPLKILLWYAADFHCFPELLTYLSDEFGYSKEELKKVIWFNSSGLRKGIVAKKYKKEIWQEIKPKMKRYSANKIIEVIPS